MFLFRGVPTDDSGGTRHVDAVVARSTAGLRTRLLDADVDFTTPLNPDLMCDVENDDGCVTYCSCMVWRELRACVWVCVCVECSRFPCVVPGLCHGRVLLIPACPCSEAIRPPRTVQDESTLLVVDGHWNVAGLVQFLMHEICTAKQVASACCGAVAKGVLPHCRALMAASCDYWYYFIHSCVLRWRPRLAWAGRALDSVPAAGTAHEHAASGRYAGRQADLCQRQR